MLNPSCPDSGNVMFGKVRNLCDEPGSVVNRITFLNLFAYRERQLDQTQATDVENLSERNREIAHEELQQSDEVVIAWGLHAPSRGLAAVWHDEVAWFTSTLVSLPVPVLAMSGLPRHPRNWQRKERIYRSQLQPFRATLATPPPAALAAGLR